MSDISKAAEALSKHMCTTFGAHVLHKEDSVEMKAVSMGMGLGKLFGAKGLSTPDQFMRNFTTTIGKNIYMPEAHRADPLTFMEILVHECQHVLQFDESNVEFAWLYLKEPEARVKYEADAYAAGLAVAQWFIGEMPRDSAASVVERLVASYSLRPEDADLATDMLKSHLASLKSGVVMARSAREAISFLASHWPALRHSVR